MGGPSKIGYDEKLAIKCNASKCFRSTCSIWTLFGPILAQKLKKRHQKINAKIDGEKAPKMMPKGVQNGAKMGPKFDEFFDFFETAVFAKTSFFHWKNNGF